MKIRLSVNKLTFIECDRLDVIEAMNKIHMDVHIDSWTGLPVIWGDEEDLYKILALLPQFYNVFLVR